MILQRHILLTAFTRASSTFLNFLTALVIARHAGPDVKGEVTLLVTTVWFVIFFSNILGGPVLVYVIPRVGIAKLLGPAYLWALLVSGVSFLFLWLGPLQTTPFIVPVTVISLLSSVVSIHHTLLMARQRINTANLLSVATLVLQTAGVFLCFYVLDVHDTYAFVYSTLTANALAAVVSTVYMSEHIRGMRLSSFNITEELKLLFQHGFLYQLVEILQLFNLRYYFFQLGLQQGNQYLGIYSIGISILESVWLIPRSIATVHYVSTSNSNEVKQEAQRTLRLSQISFVLCAIALIALWMVPAEAYVYVFGEGFSDVRHSMRFLFPGILIYSLWIVISSFYFGTGNYKPLLISNLAGVVTLLVASSFLIPLYVMSGAGLAASLSFTTATTVLLLFFLKQIPR